jgi:hypothetical protein
VASSETVLVRIVQAPLDGMIVCHDHLRQLSGAAVLAHEVMSASTATFWGDRCGMCGVDAVPDRVCESESCRKPLHPQWPAVYCCNDCALDDL